MCDPGAALKRCGAGLGPRGCRIHTHKLAKLASGLGVLVMHGALGSLNAAQSRTWAQMRVLKNQHAHVPSQGTCSNDGIKRFNRWALHACVADCEASCHCTPYSVVLPGFIYRELHSQRARCSVRRAKRTNMQCRTNTQPSASSRLSAAVLRPLSHLSTVWLENGTATLPRPSSRQACSCLHLNTSVSGTKYSRLESFANNHMTRQL